TGKETLGFSEGLMFNPRWFQLSEKISTKEGEGSWPSLFLGVRSGGPPSNCDVGENGQFVADDLHAMGGVRNSRCTRVRRISMGLMLTGPGSVDHRWPSPRTNRPFSGGRASGQGDRHLLSNICKREGGNLPGDLENQAMTVWMCALTDCSGENFWTGKGFVSADEWREYADEIPFFASQALAEAEARRLRDEYEIYLTTK